MEDQILDAPVRKSDNFTYAGFWIRFAAYFIDGIILTIAQYFLALVFFSGADLFATNYTLSLVSLLVGVAYFSGMESSARQATIGKILLKLKVGDAQGGQITFGNALGRYFAKILSFLTLLIGFMMAGWDPKKQALHDKIAGTYVFEGA